MFNEGPDHLCFQGTNSAKPGIDAIAAGEERRLQNILVMDWRLEVLKPTDAAFVELRDLGDNAKGEIEQNLRVKNSVENDANQNRKKNEEPVKVIPDLKKNVAKSRSFQFWLGFYYLLQTPQNESFF